MIRPAALIQSGPLEAGNGLVPTRGPKIGGNLPLVIALQHVNKLDTACTGYPTSRPSYRVKPGTEEQMFVQKRDGRREAVSFDKITARVTKLSYGLNTDFCDPVGSE